jgi:chemotaxis protein methyltransferase CheR
LQAFLFVELGAHDAALDAFRRCLYLDPSMLLAHAGAAIAARRLGRSALAERHSACVRALAKDQPAVAPVPGWDGMTAARLGRLFGACVGEE